MEPGGDSGGDSPHMPRKRMHRATGECSSRAEMLAVTPRYNRAVGDPKDCGVAGGGQQDFALDEGLAPQSAMGRGWQHLSAAMAATGATDMSAGPASIANARASAPPLRSDIPSEVYAARGTAASYGRKNFGDTGHLAASWIIHSGAPAQRALSIPGHCERRILPGHCRNKRTQRADRGASSKCVPPRH